MEFCRSYFYSFKYNIVKYKCNYKIIILLSCMSCLIYILLYFIFECKGWVFKDYSVFLLKLYKRNFFFFVWFIIFLF